MYATSHRILYFEPRGQAERGGIRLGAEVGREHVRRNFRASRGASQIADIYPSILT